ncbi:MAG TPA: chemotaxis protein CheA [Gemmatimonadaceae bacterium]|nr:chemotaxis protein CheA [Gemmatimonadaceae bacterium]
MTGDPRFFEQFIEDYFAETDEHLANVRRVLLELDGSTGQLAPGSTLQSLARYLHTLKGLSGMVGFAPAERVAHAMEDRARTLNELRNVDAEVVQDLFEGAALLERAVAARRSGSDVPAVDGFVERMREFDEAPAPAEATATQPGVVSTRHDAETHFVFSPSAEATARGVGVETIRQRLAGIGTIVSATPRVLGGGRVVFEFVVAVRPGAAPDQGWRDDGLEWDANHVVRHSAGALVAAPVAPTGGFAAPLAAAASNAVRVDLHRLDDIMRLVGDLVVSRARIDEMLDQRAPAATSMQWEDLREANALMERQIRALREGITRIRLVPIGEVFERMRFAMREISRDAGKPIALELQGQDTEIDKLVVDRMLEPLLHLVRNAVSHGIEATDERRARGKPAEGHVALRARAEGDRIFLEIEDDGGGIDLAAVEAQAREAGLLSHDEELAESDLLDVICAPGFSTRTAADMASGRGVGMGVVRAAVRGLGGELSVHTARNVGTRYVIELPMTLMIVDALLFEVGAQALAIPQLVLREILQLDPAAIRRIENNEVIPYRDGVLPLISLKRAFNIPAPDTGRYVLIVGADSHMTGLVVDNIIGLREIVVHPVTDPLVALPGIAGATELTNGRVSLIIDAAAIVRRGRDDARPGRLAAPSRTRRLTRELTP